MANNSDNDIFLKTSFLYGGNANYLEELQSRFEQNPSSVDAAWQNFFAGLKEERGDATRNAKGASWKQPGWPVPLNGELVAALDGNWIDVEKGIAGKLKGQAQPRGIEMSEAEVQQATRDSVKALMMIRAYRMRGHLHAKLDPLQLEPEGYHPELDPASYGFTEADLDRKIFIDHVLGMEFASVREMVDILQRTYCQTIGVEFMHISSPEEKSWIQERIEGRTRKSPSRAKASARS